MKEIGKLTIRDDRLPFIKMFLLGLFAPTVMMFLLVGAFLLLATVLLAIAGSALQLIASVPGLGYLTNAIPIYLPAIVLVLLFVWIFKRVFRHWEVSEPGRLSAVFVLGIVTVDAITFAANLDVALSEVVASIGGVAVALVTYLVSRLTTGTVRTVVTLVVIGLSLTGIVLGVSDALELTLPNLRSSGAQAAIL